MKYFSSTSIGSAYGAGEFKEHEGLWCTKPQWFNVSAQGSASARTESTHYTNSHAGETPTAPQW